MRNYLKLGIEVLLVSMLIAALHPVAASFAEEINLDSIGIAAAIGVDDNHDYAATFAFAPDGVMISNVDAGVASDGVWVEQETLAGGSEVSAASMAGNLDDISDCPDCDFTSAPVYTSVSVEQGWFYTEQGADTIEDTGTVDDLDAYQLTEAEGAEVAADTYAENEDGLSWADTYLLDGTTTFFAQASSDQDLTSAYWEGSIQAPEIWLNDGSFIYDDSISAEAWGYFINADISGIMWTWQAGSEAYAGIL
jgi:hypothetical protein